MGSPPVIITQMDQPIPEEVESALDESLRGKLNLDIYTPNDLCKRLDITRAKITQAIKLEKLRAIRFGGPIGLRIFHADVIDWLDSMATIERKRESGRGFAVRIVQ